MVGLSDMHGAPPYILIDLPSLSAQTHLAIYMQQKMQE